MTCILLPHADTEATPCTSITLPEVAARRSTAISEYSGDRSHARKAASSGNRSKITFSQVKALSMATGASSATRSEPPYGVNVAEKSDYIPIIASPVVDRNLANGVNCHHNHLLADLARTSDPQCSSLICEVVYPVRCRSSRLRPAGRPRSAWFPARAWPCRCAGPHSGRPEFAPRCRRRRRSG